MAKTIQLAEHNEIYIEVDESLPPKSGTAKAGLPETVARTAVQAGAALKEALRVAMRVNVELFQESLRDLPVKPDQAELSFGLKVSGDLGNVIITKIGAEANYAIKLSWNKLP
jgi:hypothetical protein